MSATAAVAAPAEAELLDGGVRQAAGAEIGEGGGAFGSRGAGGAKLVWACSRMSCRSSRFCSARAWAGEALGTSRPASAAQALDGFGERGAGGLHLEADRVAVNAAAEAMEMVVVDVEARPISRRGRGSSPSSCGPTCSA